MGPLLFLLYINDLPRSTELFTLLFADDTTFQISGSDIYQLYERANIELQKTSIWFKANKLTLNVKKTKFMLFVGQYFSENLQYPTLKIGDQSITQVGSNFSEKYFKYVGHVIDDQLNWNGHIEHITKKLASANYAINCSKNFLPLNIRKTVYYSLFDCHINFANLLWGCASNKKISQIENLQKKCIRNVANFPYLAHTEPIFKSLNILKIQDQIVYNRAVFMHQYRNNCLPSSFDNMFVDATNEGIQTRHNDYNYLNTPAIKTYLESFPTKQFVATWNSQKIEHKAIGSEIEFKRLLKQDLLFNYEAEKKCSKKDCYSCSHVIV